MTFLGTDLAAGLAGSAAQLAKFAPDQQGFTHWYDSRTGLSVSAWVDRIAANNLAQATGSLQPTVSTIGPSGTVPAALFDGVDDFMAPTVPWAIGNGAQYEMHAVVDPTLPATSSRLLAGSRNVTPEFAGIGTAAAVSQVYVFDKDDVICATAPRLATLANGPRVIASSVATARLLSADVDGNFVKSATAAPWSGGAPSLSWLGGTFGLFWGGKVSQLAIRVGPPRSAAQIYATAQYLLSLAYV